MSHEDASLGQWQRAWLVGQGPERKKKLCTGGLGKGRVGDPTGRGAMCVGLYVHANTCQRSPTAEEVLDSRAPSGDQP